MKINKIVLANAFAVTVAFVWTVCTFGIALFPELSLTIGQWWMHGLSMTKLGTWNVSMSDFIFGGLVLTIFAWITGYVFGWSLELFGGKKS